MCVCVGGLANAHRAPGQRLQVRFAGETDEALALASPPPPLSGNKGQLWRLKGDIYAGQTKKEAETASYLRVIDVLRPTSASPQAEEGGEVQVGPFTDEGIDLRAIIGRFQAPSLALFCDGSIEAVGALRAVIESENNATELQLRNRVAVLLFCGPCSGLPQTLSTWLAGVQEQHGFAVVELDEDPRSSWEPSAVPALRRLVELGENPGALVLGAPDFVEEMSKRLADEDVRLISTSSMRQTLARVVAPEQI